MDGKKKMKTNKKSGIRAVGSRLRASHLQVF